MVKLPLLALFLLACTPKNATPAGTTVLDWDTTKSDRTAFATAKVGTRATKDSTVRWTTSMGAVVTFKLHIEGASVDYDEGTSHMSQTAAVKVTLQVLNNDKLALDPGQCRGPNYQMPGVGPDGGLIEPKGMLLDCSVNAKLGDSNDILHLIVWGDPRVESPTLFGRVEFR